MLIGISVKLENDSKILRRHIDPSKFNLRFLYIFMLYINSDDTTKLISVTDTVYNELSKAKGKKLSFSKILLKMLDVYKNSSDINKFAGILKDKDVNSWLKEVEYGRKKGFKRHITNLE